MKKSRPESCNKTKKKLNLEEKDVKSAEISKPPKVNSLDDDEQGFGGWLRSSDGIETMKLFVIANSIVMLTTLVYPHFQAVYEIVIDMIYGSYPLYDE